ncbi:polyamine-modulated factor 1 [Elysia marginata]|uniref:Polyamine-modulated factor 1 n=1 Tax=Elysia marginata TaxID=1093978 RepID=A0AAV4F668_9GAST|nr:polyamine-modulated factor 1 [Elysia marginata]
MSTDGNTEALQQQNSLASMEDSEQKSDSNSKALPKAYKNLQNSTEKAIKRLTSKTKILPYIKEHFRKHYDADKKYFLEVYKSMMDQLEMMIMDEVNLQLEANGVEGLLSDLEKTIEGNPVTDRKWRPSGKPEEDVKAHLEKSTKEEVHQLEKVLASLECQNKLMNSHVAKTDQRLAQSLKTVQSHQQAWQKAASMMLDPETRQSMIDTYTTLTRGVRPTLVSVGNTRQASSDESDNPDKKN